MYTNNTGPKIGSICGTVSGDLTGCSAIPDFTDTVTSGTRPCRVGCSSKGCALALASDGDVLSSFSFGAADKVSISGSNGGLALASALPIGSTMAFGSTGSVPSINGAILIPCKSTALRSMVDNIRGSTSPVETCFGIGADSNGLGLVGASRSNGITGVRFAMGNSNCDGAIGAGSGNRFRLASLFPKDCAIARVASDGCRARGSRAIGIRDNGATAIAFGGILGG